jgi:hypothetical protein
MKSLSSNNVLLFLGLYSTKLVAPEAVRHPCKRDNGRNQAEHRTDHEASAQDQFLIKVKFLANKGKANADRDSDEQHEKADQKRTPQPVPPNTNGIHVEILVS